LPFHGGHPDVVDYRRGLVINMLSEPPNGSTTANRPNDGLKERQVEIRRGAAEFSRNRGPLTGNK
jgi:hypothetical protein